MCVLVYMCVLPVLQCKLVLCSCKCVCTCVSIVHVCLCSRASLCCAVVNVCACVCVSIVHVCVVCAPV
jgi:hypothetical protein